MGRLRYELTAHALIVIAERGIDLDWIERTLAEPDRTEADQGDPALGQRCGASQSGMAGCCAWSTMRPSVRRRS